MTNAEAIETLRANYPDACFEQLREAVDKAIKALEVQIWEELSKVYNMPDVPDEAKEIIGNLMLALDDDSLIKQRL